MSTSPDPAEEPLLTAIRERGVPAMRVDLAAIQADGSRLVRRRRLLGAALGAGGLAGLTALVLALGQLGPFATPPSLATQPTQPTGLPTPDTTDSFTITAGPTSVALPPLYALQDATGKSCGRVPTDLVAASRKPAEKADLKADWSIVARPVGAAATSGQAVVAEGRGGIRALRLADLRAGTTRGAVGELKAQQSASGVYDGRYAAYGVSVMDQYSAIYLWDGKTDERALIGAPDKEGWGPSSAPVLGGGYAVWTEEHRASPQAEPDIHRIVRYDIATGRLTVLLNGNGTAVGISGDTLWLLTGTGITLGASSVSAPVGIKGLASIHDGGDPLWAVSDGRQLAWVSDRKLFVLDSTQSEPRLVRTLDGAPNGGVTLSDGLAVLRYADVQADSDSPTKASYLVVDLTTGAMTRTPFVDVLGGLVLTNPSDAPISADRTNVTDAAAWKRALSTCRAN